MEIGEKRNYGAARATGDVVANWDDDDYSAPQRLADQMNRLLASGLSVTGYHSMRFTDGKKQWQYTGTPNYALGTSLCYRRDWWQDHPFLGLQVGEDGTFCEVAANAQQIATVDAGKMMEATIHDGNTSPRQLGAVNWWEIKGNT